MSRDWIALCGEPSLSGKRCIKKKNHHLDGTPMHNDGSGRNWIDYQAWDYIEEWDTEEQLPLTWNLTPFDYEFDLPLNISLPNKPLLP